MPRGYPGRFVTAAEAMRRWRERNPDKVREANRRPRKRIHDPLKLKMWRQRRLMNPGYRDEQNKKANDRATKIRRWLDQYKLKQGCIDCGFSKHHAALHFDHVRDVKLLNVCNAKSIGQAMMEIKKCEVRCANCHSIQTFTRLQISKGLVIQ